MFDRHNRNTEIHNLEIGLQENDKIKLAVLYLIKGFITGEHQEDLIKLFNSQDMENINKLIELYEREIKSKL